MCRSIIRKIRGHQLRRMLSNLLQGREDCRVEWRLDISSEKAAIIESENQITEEEMSLRERYGELKGVTRVNEMDQDYKDRKNFKDIFKNVKKDLLDAKREITKVIVKEKQQQALKVRKNNKRKDDGAFDIAEITKKNSS